MVALRIKIATTLALMALMGGSLWLRGHSSTRAEQPAPSQPAPPATLPGDEIANPPEKDVTKEAKRLFEVASLGFVHDFGKVQRGTRPTHTLHFCNTTNLPLTICSVRASMSPLTMRVGKQRLQPYEEGTLEIAVDTRRFIGPRSWTVYLTTDDGTKTVETRFTISADCQDLPQQ